MPRLFYLQSRHCSRRNTAPYMLFLADSLTTRYISLSNIMHSVSGVMACALDVFVFPVKQIQESVYEMFSRWLNSYGGKDETSSSKIIDTISGHLMRFKDRFKKLVMFNDSLRTSSDNPMNIADCLGYIYELEGTLTFYCTRRSAAHT